MGMFGVSGISMRMFKALAAEYINVILISQASSENSISILVESKDAALASETINNEFEHEINVGHVNAVHIESDMAVVAIVGERMKHNTGVSVMLFNSVGTYGINVYAIAQGASEVNISFVFKDEDLKRLDAVHDSFFLSHYQVLHLFWRVEL